MRGQLADKTQELPCMNPFLVRNVFNHLNAKEINYQMLKNATGKSGKPFRILRIPMPKTIYCTARPTDGVYVCFPLQLRIIYQRNLFPSR